MSYTIGNMEDEAPKQRGWFVGTFIDETSAARTDVVEIKYTEFPVGPTDHPMKTSAIFECSIFLAGRAKAIIDGQEHILEAGQFVAIQPNTPNNLVVEILKPVTVLTIKAPSDPSAKKIIA